jgi:chitinase
MNSWMRVLLVLLFSIFSATAFSYTTRCISTPNHRLILSAFYFPGNAIISPNALSPFKDSVAHLDALNYSTSRFGVIYRHDAYIFSDIAKQNLITIQQWLHNNHLQTKVFLSLGHWSSSRFHQIFIDQKAQNEFIAAVIGIVKQKAYGIQGVDLDWENFFSPRGSELRAFPGFVKNMRQALDRNGLQHVCLTLDLPVATKFAKIYPKPANWANEVDWANVMAYQYYGLGPDHTELDATLGEVTAPYAGKTPHYENLSLVTSLDYYVQHNLPRNKIVIALPFYGNMNYIHDATTDHGLRQEVIDSRSIITMDYSNIYDTFGVYGYPKNGASIYEYTFAQPANVSGTHAFWGVRFITESPQAGKSYKFVSYLDPVSAKEITQFAEKAGYLGLSAWELDNDLPYGNPHSLLRAMYTTVHAP